MGFLNRNQPGANNYAVTNERVSLIVSGWTSIQGLGHLCWPPRQYPREAGPGSQWRCYCGGLWEAVGVQQRGDYPLNPNRGDAFVGPARWLWVAGARKAERCALTPEQEQGLYDWRTAAEVIVPLLERIEEQGLR